MNLTGNELAETIKRLFEKYVVFHSDFAEAEAGTLTLWVFHSYVWQLADFAVYLLIFAPTSEAGKSRIYDVARPLVHMPMVVVDPTPASLYRAIDEMRPTLMVDEADMLHEHPSLRVVLNAGFQPGTPVPRAGASFEVFCPKMFSGIAGDKLPITEATLSRCIQIPMRRKAPHENVTRLNRRHLVIEAAPLKANLETWAEDNKEFLESADPAFPSGMTDRQIDSWSQMLAIADLIGWGDKAREWAVTLSNAIPKAPDPAVQILRDIKKVLDDYKGNRIPSAELARLRNDLDGREFEEDMSAQQLGHRLAGFGIHRDSSPFRPKAGDRTQVRGYTIRRAGKYLPAWEDAFVRYGLMTATDR